MDSFETLMQRERISVERFVRFRLQSQADADDVLQETWISAYQNFDKLKNPDAFRAWILSIARNKCTDYFRRKSAQLEIPIDELHENRLVTGVRGLAVRSKRWRSSATRIDRSSISTSGRSCRRRRSPSG